MTGIVLNWDKVMQIPLFSQLLTLTLGNLFDGWIEAY